MKKFLEAIKTMGTTFAIKQIRSRKEEIIKKINAKLDIPLLSEKDEKALLEGIWSLIDEVLEDVSNDSYTAK